MGAHPGSAPSPIVRLGAPLCWALDASPCLCQGRFRWRQRAPRQRLTAFVPWSTWPVSWPATVPNNLLSSRCGLHLVLPLPVPTCLCIAATHLPFCWSGSPFVPLPLQAMPTYFGARFNHQAGRTGGWSGTDWAMDHMVMKTTMVLVMLMEMKHSRGVGPARHCHMYRAPATLFV